MSQTVSRVVIIGGGFAGCKIAQLLLAEQSMQVTLIDPKDFFEMVWVNPRAIVAPDWAQRSIVPYTSFIPRVQHVKDEAAALDSKKVTTKSGKTIEFDFCVIAVGSSYAGFLKASSSAASATQRLSELHALSEQIKRAAHVLVVGGGAMPPNLYNGKPNDMYLMLRRAIRRGDRVRNIGRVSEQEGRILELLGDTGASAPVTSPAAHFSPFQRPAPPWNDR